MIENWIKEYSELKFLLGDIQHRYDSMKVVVFGERCKKFLRVTEELIKQNVEENIFLNYAAEISSIFEKILDTQIEVDGIGTTNYEFLDLMMNRLNIADELLGYK